MAAEVAIGQRRREGIWLLTPMTLFLLILLGFPLVLDIIYSLSKVGFETLRDPEIIGFGNYGKAIADPEFWAAAWFSFRFAIIVATVQVLLGLGLAIFLAPLLDQRPWLMAILMLPMMVAPALVGLMYRLILHEFVGVIPYYLYLWLGDSPSFLGAQSAFNTLVTIEILQWTPFALLILYTAYAAIPVLDPRGGGARRRDGAQERPLHRPADDDAGDRRHLFHPLHRFLPGLRQRLHPGRPRRRRLDHDDEHLHLPGLLPRRRRRPRRRRLDAAPRRLLRRALT